MSSVPHSPSVWNSLGITSLVIGLIGLALCFFPILGMPVSAVGVLLGALGFFVTRARNGPGIPWCLGGFTLSVIALGVNFAEWYSPSGILPKIENSRGELGPSAPRIPPDAPPPER